MSKRARDDTEDTGAQARIEHGLATMPVAKIVAHLKEAAKTDEGLKHLAALFSSEVMATPQKLHCLRCDEDFDPQYGSVCRKVHPGCCRTHWDGSKKSWQECMRCGGCFNVDGFHGWDKKAPEDVGEWCFEGEHTTEQAVVDDEDWDGEYYD